MKIILKWIGCIVGMIILRIVFEKIGISDWLNGYFIGFSFGYLLLSGE